MAVVTIVLRDEEEGFSVLMSSDPAVKENAELTVAQHAGILLRRTVEPGTPEGNAARVAQRMVFEEAEAQKTQGAQEIAA